MLWCSALCGVTSLDCQLRMVVHRGANFIAERIYTDLNFIAVKRYNCVNQYTYIMH